MRFRFCGDNDCPDWVLADVDSTLAVLSSIKLQVLTECVAKSIIEDEIMEEKVQQIFRFSKMGIGASKSAVSCLHFLLVSATRHNVEDTVFETELQQIGLPKEHSLAICRVLSEYISKIRKKLLESKFTVNEFEDASYSIDKTLKDCAQFQFKIKNEIIDGISRHSQHNINIDKSHIQLLLRDLKKVSALMETYNFEEKYSSKAS